MSSETEPKPASPKPESLDVENLKIDDSTKPCTSEENITEPSSPSADSPYEENDKMKMFVGGLSWQTKDEGLKAYFEKFGKVKEVSIKKDQHTQRSRGFAFVVFEEEGCVEKVLAHEDHQLDGRKIDAKKAKALKKECKLFVGGVNPETTDEVIKEYFSEFGEVTLVERPLDRTTKKPRGFCFVSFKELEACKTILAKESKMHTIDGREVEVKDGSKPKHQRRTAFNGFPRFHDAWMFGGQAYPYPGQFYGQYGNGFNMYNNYNGYNGKNNYRGKRNYNNQGGYQKQYSNGGGYQKQYNNQGSYNNYQQGGYQANDGYQANYSESYNQVGGGYTNGNHQGNYQPEKVEARAQNNYKY